MLHLCSNGRACVCPSVTVRVRLGSQPAGGGRIAGWVSGAPAGWPCPSCPAPLPPSTSFCQGTDQLRRHLPRFFLSARRVPLPADHQAALHSAHSTPTGEVTIRYDSRSMSSTSPGCVFMRYRQAAFFVVSQGNSLGFVNGREYVFTPLWKVVEQ